MPWPLIAVAETASYLASARKILSDEERNGIIDVLAADPARGVLIPGTGGVRKLRFGRGSTGKSGGVRIIYYFHDPSTPIYLLAGFAKNEKANLSAAERGQLRRLVGRLLDERRKA